MLRFGPRPSSAIGSSWWSALALLAISTSIPTAAVGAESLQSSGKVTSVTLYRGQALVQRTISVSGAAGAVELVVPELP